MTVYYNPITMNSQESEQRHLDLLEQSRESMNIQKMHPDKVPILVIKSPKSNLQDIENNKYPSYHIDS